MNKSTGQARAGVPAQVVVTAFLFVIAAYFLLPVWWLVVAGTKSSSDLFGSQGFWFAQFHLVDNLKELLTQDDGAFLHWSANSVLYTIGGSAGAALLSAMFGYALAMYSFRGRNLLFAIVLGSLLIPLPLLALPQYLLMTKIGMINTYWAFLLPSLLSPFGVYLCRVYAEASVPRELLEAGRIDGAGELRLFLSVGLRLMAPALVTVFLFQFVGIWNNYFLPLIVLNNDKLWPLSLGLVSWQGQLHAANWNIVVTGSLVSVVPLIIAFTTLQRYWRSDLAAGSVKF